MAPATVRIVTARDTVDVQVEIAETPSQRRQGLRGRNSLPPDGGMLFLFPEQQPPSASFWMHDTLLPLDIAFLDSAGVIRGVRGMVPCRALLSLFCARYGAGVPFLSALEVNAGFLARHGVSPGDRTILVRDP